MEMTIAASTAPPGAADAFIKLLIAIYKANEFDYGTNFQVKLKKWNEQAQPFLEQYTIKRTFAKTLSMLVNGDDVSNEKYSIIVAGCFDSLKKKKKAFDKDKGLSKLQLSFLNDVRLAYKGSTGAASRIMQNVGHFKDSHISKMFMHEGEHVDTSVQQSLYDRLEQHVKTHGKVKGHVMPNTTLEKWRDKAKEVGSNLTEHQDYLDMRRQRKAIADKAIANIVRASGEHIVDVDVIREQMNGVQHDIPDWFVGKIDDKGNYFTTDGLQLLNKPIGEGHMNPNYKEGSTVYYCQYKAPFAQNMSNVYTIAARTEGRVQSFNVVQNMLPDVTKYVKKWLPDLAKGPGSLRGVAAAVCETIYQTSARIGSTRANTAGETTYGISTLLRKHALFNDQRVILKYIGKKGGAQKHIIKFDDQRSQMLHAALDEFLFEKKPTEYIFTFRGKPLSNSQVNGYLRELGFPEGFTIHKFRKLRGTAMAKVLMDKCPFGGRARDADVNAWIEKQCLNIGKELGHMAGEKVTATTAIANYIDPSVFLPVYEKTNTRPNSKIQKAIDLATKSVE